MTSERLSFLELLSSFLCLALKPGHLYYPGFPGVASSKEGACRCRRLKRCRFGLWGRKIPWRRPWQPTPVFLPGESHGQRNLEDDVESMGLQRVGHEWAHTHMHTHFRKEAWCWEWSHTNDRPTQQWGLKKGPESRTIHLVIRGLQNCNLGLTVTPARRPGPACRQGTETTKKNSTLSGKCQARTFMTLLPIKKKISELVTGRILVP